MDQFDVYVAGFEVDEARAIKGMMRTFGLGEPAARIFVQSVPRMAKRKVTEAAAQKYTQALRSLGAIVDCRPSEDSMRPAPGLPSLPAPVGSPTPRRTATSVPPAPMPPIPRAPRLPEGLAPRMASSEFPADLAPGPAIELMRASAAPSQRVSPIPGARSSSGPAHVGLSHSFTPERPGSSLAPLIGQRTASGMPWYASRWSLGFVAVAVALAIHTANQRGMFSLPKDALETAWARAGIDPGVHEDARTFFARKDSRFVGRGEQDVTELLDGLERAGAKRLWAIEISERDGMREASTLLVELPGDAAGRRTIFFQHARSAAGHAPTDVGQAFLRIAL